MAHDPGHGGLRKYLIVGILLAILTAISFATGSSQMLMHDAKHLGWTIMMAVSCCKALLVMLFFMHLIWEANWKYVLTIPASIMSMFLLLMLVPDIGYRYRSYSEERLLHAADARIRATHSPLEETTSQEAEPPSSSDAEH